MSKRNKKLSDKIAFRGREVISDWPERLKKAQLDTKLIANGTEMSRVRYGEETEDWGADKQPCHDCAAIKGEYHVPGCDVERCPSCDMQLLSCSCDIR